MITDLALLRLLQLVSPGLPIGMYSYSQGMEWAVEDGLITDADETRSWLAAIMSRCQARVDLPVLARLYEVWLQDDTALADLTIYVIDVSAGDKIPRKGGPGITRSDLLVINKIDLAPYVGASLEVMARDAAKMRGSKPFVFTNLKKGEGLKVVKDFIIGAGVL